MTENGTFSSVVIPAKAGIQEKLDFFNGLLMAEVVPARGFDLRGSG